MGFKPQQQGSVVSSGPPTPNPGLATLQNSREHAKVWGIHTTKSRCLSPAFGRLHAEWVEPVASQNLGEH